MKKLLLILLLMTNTCFAASPATFHDSWNVRDYYERVNTYLECMKATGHHFYDNVRGLESHIVTFNNDENNILFVAEQDDLIVQIVAADNDEKQLKEKVLATLKVFGANATLKDLENAKNAGAVMIDGKDRKFVIRYEHPGSYVYVLYAAK